MEFANSYHRTVVPETNGAAAVRSILESDMYEIVDTDVQETQDVFPISKFVQGQCLLRALARNPFERDASLQEVLDHLDKNIKKIDKHTNEKCSKIFQILFTSPNTTEKPELRNSFLKIMNDLSQMPKNIITNSIEELTELGDSCFKAINNWRTRAKLKESKC